MCSPNAPPRPLLTSVLIFDHLIGILSPLIAKAKKVAGAAPTDGVQENDESTLDTNGEALPQHQEVILPMIYLHLLKGHPCGCENCDSTVMIKLLDEAIIKVKKEKLAKLKQAKIDAIKSKCKGENRQRIMDQTIAKLKKRTKKKLDNIKRQDAIEANKAEVTPSIEARYQGEMRAKATKDVKATILQAQKNRAVRMAQEADYL